ncbi:MAG: SseB family protein [Verrucomicrobiaceae bacterium]|nr:SseB family protein [Verrucomicrobiaceae bacterium]
MSTTSPPPSPTPARGDFTPHNHLEAQMKRLLTDKHTPLWDFYTPLAAATLWNIVPASADPEKTGRPPPFCLFDTPNSAGQPTRYITAYTSRDRAEQALTLWAYPEPMIVVGAKGHPLLHLLRAQDVDELWLNFGLPECQCFLDPDMIDILLERPEPPDPPPARRLPDPEGDPTRYLQPVKELLARDPAVCAAWIFTARPGSMLPRGESSYELALLMKDPDDEHLLRQVEAMAKALTPCRWNGPPPSCAASPRPSASSPTCTRPSTRRRAFWTAERPPFTRPVPLAPREDNVASQVHSR